MHQASVGFHCPECAKKGRQQVYQGIPSLRTKPVLTYVLIGINVAVFVLGIVLGGSGSLTGGSDRLMSDYGLIAKYGVRGYIVPGLGVGEGEWYRMVTSGFLHYGIIHLALNMYALWILGQAVEHIGGRLRFGLIYATALLAGSFGALVLSPDALTAGASGAIYGLMGAIFVAQRAQGIPFRNSPLLPVLVLNLVFTFGLAGISIGGHLGGLAGGAAAGWLLFDLPRQRRDLPSWLPGALCGAVMVACLIGGVVFASGYTPS